MSTHLDNLQTEHSAFENANLDSTTNVEREARLRKSNIKLKGLQNYDNKKRSLESMKLNTLPNICLSSKGEPRSRLDTSSKLAQVITKNNTFNISKPNKTKSDDEFFITNSKMSSEFKTRSIIKCDSKDDKKKLSFMSSSTVLSNQLKCKTLSKPNLILRQGTINSLNHMELGNFSAGDGIIQRTSLHAFYSFLHNKNRALAPVIINDNKKYVLRKDYFELSFEETHKERESSMKLIRCQSNNNFGNTTPMKQLNEDEFNDKYIDADLLKLDLSATVDLKKFTKKRRDDLFKRVYIIEEKLRSKIEELKSQKDSCTVEEYQQRCYFIFQNFLSDKCLMDMIRMHIKDNKIASNHQCLEKINVDNYIQIIKEVISKILEKERISYNAMEKHNYKCKYHYVGRAVKHEKILKSIEDERKQKAEEESRVKDEEKRRERDRIAEMYLNKLKRQQANEDKGQN